MEQNFLVFGPGNKRGIWLKLIILLFLSGNLVFRNFAEGQQVFNYSMDTTTLFDQTRNRSIPIAIYKPKVLKPAIIIFSHGYSSNRPGSYLDYSYLTDFLAGKGYFVVSIQHELPTDSLMPLQGILQVVRRPFWERGCDNILFVINELKKSYPQLDFKNITLMGHSHGGDMTALFPVKYPGTANKIITLDNKRVPLPEINGLKVYSLRSSDQQADNGVLPDEDEAKRYGVVIIKLPHTTHNEMNDRANDQQRKEIRDYVLTFLK